MNFGFYLNFLKFFNKDSLKPLYSFERVKDDKWMLILRVILFILSMFYIGYVYMFPETYDGLGDILVESYGEVVVWGKDKIAFNYTKDISNRTITYENLKEQEEEFLEKEYGVNNSTNSDNTAEI